MLVFKMLKRHFGNESYYPQLVDLFLETTFQVTRFSTTSIFLQQLATRVDWTQT
jgi:hypothetical protein